MYCGSCLRDNALAAALKARGHDVDTHADLHADDHRRAQRQQSQGALRRHQRLPAAALSALPPHAGLPRRLWDSAPVLRAGVEAADQGRPDGARRDDGVDAARPRGATSARRSTRCCAGCATEPRFDVVDAAVHAAHRPGGAAARRLARAAGLRRCRARTCFSNSLQEPWKSQALALIRRRRRTTSIVFIAVSEYYAASWRATSAFPATGSGSCPSASASTGQTAARRRGATPPFTVGFFAPYRAGEGPARAGRRLPAAADAARRARRRGCWRAATCSTSIGEYLGEIDRSTDASAGLDHEFEYAGAPDRAGKIALLQQMDVMSMPATYDEPKGLSLLEAHGQRSAPRAAAPAAASSRSSRRTAAGCSWRPTIRTHSPKACTRSSSIATGPRATRGGRRARTPALQHRRYGARCRRRVPGTGGRMLERHWRRRSITAGASRSRSSKT